MQILLNIIILFLLLNYDRRTVFTYTVFSSCLTVKGNYNAHPHALPAYISTPCLSSEKEVIYGITFYSVPIDGAVTLAFDG